MGQTALIDRFGRRHNQLRLSVTDRCNLRCTYCMGENGVPWLEPGRILRYEEILAVVRIAAELGMSRVRLTGGEPLVRKDLAWLVRELRRIPGIEDLSLTTNGILLGEQADELRRAGLDRVNISLDSLNPETYGAVTRGGQLARVLDGIETALAVGFWPVKINVVLMKGVNDGDIPEFLRLAFSRPLHLRFIECMPIGRTGLDHGNRYLTVRSVLETAASLGFALTPCDPPSGSGPAETYAMRNGEGTIGLIHPISRHFCSACNRLRLTADGYLKPCLYWQEELSVRPVLDRPDELRRLFRRAMELKRPAHRMSTEAYGHIRCMSRTGG